ncbi:MAG: hypothetical protein ABIS67_15900 [Candidatus Eisenbacteria bacterium]
MATIAHTWWPLAASWFLMGLELPAVSAAMARLPDPERSLAAYGGLVFPLALIIESPIIMLLAASTALSRDTASYRLGRRYMYGLGFTFTALHGLVAFSPLFDLLARRVIGVPEEIIEPARLGMRIMLPWTISIAYRRFQQGVLIRFGESRAVTVGTLYRLAAIVAVLGAGLAIGRWPGIVVGATAVIAGVVAEAFYSAWRVRAVVEGPLRRAGAVAPPLDSRAFLHFYLPLLVTPLFMFLTMPLASGAMSRLPRPLESLAVWPAINGFVFALRSSGFAFNEVVVSLWDRPGAAAALKRFALMLSACTTAAMLVLAVTPAGAFWFSRVAGLPPALAALGAAGLLVALPLPGLSALQSLHQGALVHSRRTRGITESMMLLLAVSAAGMAAGGLLFPAAPGLWIALAGLGAGNAAQWAWLAWRARGVGAAA